MTGLALLDASIGIVFALVVFSLVASAIQEAVANLFNTRGRMLHRALYNFFLAPGGALLPNAPVRELLDHEMIRLLKGPSFGGRRRFPSAIPPPVFARACISLMQRLDRSELSFRYGSLLEALALEPEMKARFQEEGVHPNALTKAERERLEAALIETYDGLMERVRGWYRRRVRGKLFVLGFALAAVVNFDLLGYAQQLVDEELAPDGVGAHVSRGAGSVPPGTGPEARIDGRGPPGPRLDLTSGKPRLSALGWSCRPSTGAWTCLTESFPRNLLSWLIVAFATMMGAQFWFDLLNQVLGARTAVAGRIGGARAPAGAASGSPASGPSTS